MLQRLVERWPRWGFSKMCTWLRKQGHRWNHKRIYRVYCDLGLNLRVWPKKRLPLRHPVPLAQFESPNICWSLEFNGDSLESGRPFQILNIIDDFHRFEYAAAYHPSSVGKWSQARCSTKSRTATLSFHFILDMVHVLATVLHNISANIPYETLESRRERLYEFMNQAGKIFDQLPTAQANGLLRHTLRMYMQDNQVIRIEAI